MDEEFERVLNNTKKPSDIIKSIFDYEKNHLEYFTKNYNGFIRYFEHSIEILIIVIECLNYVKKDKWKEYNTIQFLIIVNNIETIFSSYSRLIYGFYSDSFILFRSVYESILRIYYIDYHPSEKEKVLYDNGKPKFNITNFMKNELKVDWNNYKLLSSFGHSNSYNVLFKWKDISENGQKDVINMELSTDDNMISLGINYLTFILYSYLLFIKEILLVDEFQRNYKSEYENLIDTINLLGDILYNTPNKQIPKMYEDTNNIITGIKNNYN